MNIKPLLSCTFIILLTFSAKAQDPVFNFVIKKSVTRVKENGHWGRWEEFGNINTKMSQNLIVNFEGKSIVWLTQLEGKEKKATNFQIVDLVSDTSYKDFGISTLTIQTKTTQQRDHIFKIVFLESEIGPRYIMISGTDIIQSKHFGQIEKMPIE